MNAITFEEFENEVKTAINNRSPYLRPGQAAYNYVYDKFGDIATKSQYKYGIDCYYKDEIIDDFIKKCYEILSNNE